MPTVFASPAQLESAVGRHLGQMVARGEAPRSTHVSTSSEGERCIQSDSAL
jgi:hypothetical protein